MSSHTLSAAPALEAGVGASASAGPGRPSWLHRLLDRLIQARMAEAERQILASDYRYASEIRALRDWHEQGRDLRATHDHKGV